MEADLESRYSPFSKFEWSLKDEFFQIIMCKFGTCKIDLFASRLNNKLDRYVSFRPDPGAEAINAFSYDWTINKLYIFPVCYLAYLLAEIFCTIYHPQKSIFLKAYCNYRMLTYKLLFIIFQA